MGGWASDFISHASNVTGITHATESIGSSLSHPETILSDVTKTTYQAYSDTTAEAYRNRGVALGVAVTSIPGMQIAGLSMIAGSLYDQDASNQIYDVVTGKYADEQEKLQEKQENYEDAIANYEKVMADLKNKFIIPEEIFQLAYGNKAERTSEAMMSQLDALRADLEAAMRDFNDKYDFIQKTLDHKFLKYFMWVPLVIGGLANDTSDFMTQGDWAAGRRVLSVILNIVAIVIAVVITILTWGASTPFTAAMIAGSISSLIGLILSLDGMYGQGLLMNGVWSSLDFLLNDVLHLDGIKELGTDKLSDSKYYEELTGYFSTLNTIVGIAASIVAVYTAPANLGAQVSKTFGISSGVAKTYAGISSALNAAMTVGDILEQNKQYEALKDKMEEDISKLNSEISAAMSRKMMSSYREVEDMLTYTSNIVSEHAMSAFASPTTSFDPEMTIAANFGYRYQGTSFMDFGVEDMFVEGGLAGGDSYMSDILYRI